MARNRVNFVPFSAVAAILLFSFNTSFMAQTRSELDKKYGSANDHPIVRKSYVARPGVLVTASFTLDNQICEAVIEPELVDGRTISSYYEKTLPSFVADQVINELAPLEQRGKRLLEIKFNGRFNEADYEHLHISQSVWHVKPEEKVVYQARIIWKDRKCV